MCVCDETGVCPPGCKYRPDGREAWHGHDAATAPGREYEPPDREQEAREEAERAGRLNDARS